MPGIPFSKVNWSTREEALTSDFNRAHNLIYREILDGFADASRGDESLDGANPQNGQGVRASGADRLPVLISASGFTMDLSFGQAYLQNDGVSDITSSVEDSQYQVVRWLAQNVAFTTPDGANPRIDLVVATPGLISTDSASRNILVNPVTRATSPAPVFKSINPQATVTVVAGTPDPQPTAPAVPSGGLALFEVYIPAGGADSTTFKLSRRVQRRAVSIGTSMHGILRGCNLAWDSSFDETINSALTVGSSSTTEPSRVIIDGEVITFTRLSTTGPTNLPGVVQDAGANNPFTAAAPANADKPYYIYLCGGKNLNQGRRTSLSGNQLQPVVLVESLVAPTLNGRPGANITTPRGTTTAGALFIGVGFVVRNTTLRKACYIVGDWVYAQTGQNGPTGGGGVNLAGFNDNIDRVATLSGSAGSNHTINTKPALSTQALINTMVQVVGAPSTYGFFTIGQAVGTDNTTGEGWVDAVAAASASVTAPFTTNLMNIPGTTIRAQKVVNVGNFSSFFMWARGWNMKVPRYTV